MNERALIIGGTGMLTEASRWIAARAGQTVLAARNVILGRNGGRWLSKAEISAGVIAALEAPFVPRTVVRQ